MKEMFKNKKIIVFLILLLVVTIGAVFIIISGKDEVIVDQEEGKIDNVETSEVEQMYSIYSKVGCDNELIWDFSNKDKLGFSDLDNTTKLNIIYAALDIDSKLNEELTNSEFSSYAKKIFGNANGKLIDNYDNDYKGKKYEFALTGIKITDSTSCENSQFVSKLFGYTYNEDLLSMDIAVGKVVDNKLFDISGAEIGKFDNEEQKHELLNSCDIYRYGFKLENGNYYFDNITKVVTVKAQ